jgi:hypothetical protein
MRSVKMRIRFFTKWLCIIKSFLLVTRDMVGLAPNIMKQLQAQTSDLVFMLVRFKSFLHSSDIPLYWLKELWSGSRVSLEQRQISLFRIWLLSPSIAAWSVYCTLYGRNQTLASQLRQIAVLCVLTVNSNIVLSFHHTMATKRPARNATSAYAFSGTSRSTTQRRDSVRWCGVTRVFTSSR